MRGTFYDVVDRILYVWGISKKLDIFGRKGKTGGKWNELRNTATLLVGMIMNLHRRGVVPTPNPMTAPRPAAAVARFEAAARTCGITARQSSRRGSVTAVRREVVARVRRLTV